MRSLIARLLNLPTHPRTDADVTVIRATLARTRAEREHAWTLLRAIKRTGVLPGPAWERAVNCCTASESESDLERDKAAAEDLRKSLQAADSTR